MQRRTRFAVFTVSITLAGLGVIIAENFRSDTTTIGVASGKNSVPLQSKLPVQSALPVEPARAVPELATAHHIARLGEEPGSLTSDLRDRDGEAYRHANAAVAPVLQADPTPAATPTAAIDLTKQMKYTAAAGDTVTMMAAAFLGNSDKEHRDAITDANASLKADPDHVVVGQTYKIQVTNGLTAAPVEMKADTVASAQPDADGMTSAAAPKMLQYTARPGDTLTSMALALLGSDAAAARTAIISHNPSLKSNPEMVVAGQTYSIPAPIAVSAQR